MDKDTAERMAYEVWAIARRYHEAFEAGEATATDAVEVIAAIGQVAEEYGVGTYVPAEV